MLFFAGFAVGTFGAGLISDRYGRKSAIVLMAQLLFGCGILTATMSNTVGFTIMWFFTGTRNTSLISLLISMQNSLFEPSFNLICPF